MAAALTAPAAAAHGTGLGSVMMKLFHWTCIGSMVFMAAAHGGSLLTMASNFVNMHIIPGLAAAPQAITNLGSAFAHAVGMGAAPAIDPGIVMDHTGHIAQASAPHLQAEWLQAASPDLKAAFSALPPDLAQQFNQQSPALKNFVIENYTDMSAGGKRSLASIITDVCQPR